MSTSTKTTGITREDVTACSPADIAVWIEEERARERQRQQRVHRVVERDTEHQEDVARHGGTMFSTITEAAQRAVDVIADKARTMRNAIADPRAKVIRTEHERLVRRKIDAERQCADANVELEEFESVADALLRRLERPLLHRLADTEAQMRALHFAGRAARVLNPATSPKSKPLGPVASPDYSDIV